ncbi:hypothetical protein VAEKB19_80005 [Vibrio aestuarianus]|nr:hypothetical protein VAEKB19_80005 [Vibrio aestuarianus]
MLDKVTEGALLLSNSICHAFVSCYKGCGFQSIQDAIDSAPSDESRYVIYAMAFIMRRSLFIAITSPYWVNLQNIPLFVRRRPMAPLNEKGG